MKMCAYCGRENADAAVHCHECGTDEFKAAGGADSVLASHAPCTTEDDFICRLRASLPKDKKAFLEAITLADEAVRAFPTSAKLWVIRGDLIRTAPQPGPRPLEEAVRSYQRAVEITPGIVTSETREELRDLIERLTD